MDYIVLWTMLFSAVILMIFTLRKPHFVEKLLVFLLTGFVANFIALFIIEQWKMYYHPVRFLPEIFHSNFVFDYFFFPAYNALFYITTYSSKIKNIILQAFIYSSILTLIEQFSELYTNVIKFKTWNIWYSFLGEFLFFVTIRAIVKFIYYYDKPIHH